MNAYELADFIDKYCEDNTSKEAAVLLRQQADRIAELEKQGEPVAWMEYIQDEEWEVWYTEPTDLPEGHSYKPLYLAPQRKPLSDDEIFKLGSKLRISTTEIECNWHPVVLEFARAIEERHGIK